MREKKILYLEVSKQIKQDIIEGKYPLDTMIPTENELVEQFNVSKITIRKAVQLLVDDGYVKKQSGRGTIVLSNRPFNIMNRAQSYTSLLNQKGKRVETEFLSIKEVDETDAEVEHVRFVPGLKYKLTRRYLIDGEESILFYYIVSVPDESLINEIKKDKDFSLYSFLASKERYIASIKDAFKVVKADNEIMKKLSSAIPYVLERTRYSYDRNGKVIEKAISYYNTDSNAYEIEYQV